MLSIVLTRAEHQAFTNAWLDFIGRSNSLNPKNTNTVTREQIMEAARVIYKDYPEILRALGL
jgi:hypothetical protein